MKNLLKKLFALLNPKKLKPVWIFTKTQGKKCGILLALKLKALPGDIKHTHQHWQLKRLPWYLVLGASQAGKTSLLANAGLLWTPSNLLSQQAQRYTETFATHRWWFSEQAVFIEANENLAADTRFLKHVKRKRRRKPLNGVLLCLDLPQLIQLDLQSAQQQLAELAKQLQMIHAILKLQIPLYLVCTHSDQIIGFTEFFSDLSKEELQQFCGVSFPLETKQSLTDLEHLFQSSYRSFTQQLQERLVWTLAQEKDNTARERLFHFPQQLQVLAGPLLHWIQDLTANLSKNNAVLWRGVYFISSCQQGVARDFIAQLLQQRYGVRVDSAQPLPAQTEPYFTHQLFSDIIVEQGQRLGHTQFTDSWKKRLTRFSPFLSGMLLVAGLIWMTVAYHDAKNNLNDLANGLTQYQTAHTTFKNNNARISTLSPLLDPLNQAIASYKNTGFFNRVIFYSADSTYRAFLHGTQRLLGALFLPRVAIALETELQKPQSSSDHLYALLKAYLAFGGEHEDNANMIQIPMDYAWIQNWTADPARADALRQDLYIALQNDVPTLPINQSIIEKAGVELGNVASASRAYQLMVLKAPTESVSAISVSERLNNTMPLFTNNSHAIVSALYTKQGFQKIFQAHGKELVAAVEADKLANNMADTSSIDKTAVFSEFSEQYDQDYHAAWLQAYQHLQLAPWSSLNDAINQLDLLHQKNSVLIAGFQLMDQQTQSASDGVRNAFSDYHQFVKGKWPAVKPADILVTIQKVQAAFITLQTQKDLPAACFAMAVSYMQSDPKNPLVLLAQQAEQAPLPAKILINKVLAQAWGLIASQTRSYLNALWQNQIVQPDWALMTQRYPLNASATAEIAPSDFAQLFGPQGMLSQFFKTNLQMFIDTHASPWQEYAIDGQSLGLAPSVLSAFETLQSWQQTFFNGGVLHLQLTLTPQTLSNTATNVELLLGSSDANYFHGPLQPQIVNWPYNPSQNSSTMNITTFDGQHLSLNFTGDWSLFRLLQQATWKPLSATDYQLTFTEQGQTASFTLSGVENATRLNPNFFSQVTWPQQLGANT